MPYCRKCGTKLDDDARFCPACGTPVTAITATTRSTAPNKRKTVYVLPTAVLIVVLVTAAIIAALIFLPVNPISINQTRQVDSEAGVDNLILNFQADVAQVNVFFENMPDKMLFINATASGWTGLLDDPSQLMAITFYSETVNDTVTARSRVSHANMWLPQFSLNVVCNLYLDPSAKLNLTIRSDVGQIKMNAATPITFEELNLETTTGSIDVSLSKDTVVTGSVSLKTTTGSVQFKMEKADVSGNVSVDLQSTTGWVNVDLAATKLSGNATVNAQTTTGSVNLHMTIENDVGARIESDTDLGRIAVDVERFSGNQSPIQSSNYPAGSNFLVNLRTTTGGISINAVYGSSAVLN